MEASLRYATLLPVGIIGDSSFTFPWYKQVNGDNYFLHFRRMGCLPYETNFCLDLGKFAGKKDYGLGEIGGEEHSRFISFAWRDFMITEKRFGRRTPGKHLIGEGSRENAVNNFNPYYIVRPGYAERSPRGYWGIYVSPETRGHKVGAALITSARIILHQLGIRILVLKEIAEIEEGSMRRCFHEHLGGRFFDIHEDEYMYTHEKVLCGKVAYPTRATERCPYRFE